MKLTLEGLRAAGAFSGRPVEKDITWKQDGEEHTVTVFIRPVGYHTAVGDIAAHLRGDSYANRIASSICDEEGKAVFTAADVTGEADPERGALNDALVLALLVAINAAQNMGKTKA